MFEKEEVKLNKMKERLDKIHLPLDEADNAIRQGFERAKREKVRSRKKRNRIWSLVVAALAFRHLRNIHPCVASICKRGRINSGHGEVRGFDSV